MRCKSHVRFGERPGETDREQPRHRAPGRLLCTRAAFSADLDHTQDWIDAGLTIAVNLGAGCRRCHRIKHEHRWQLRQPRAGQFVWQTSSGATYVVEPRPILESLPAPMPRPESTARPVIDIEPPFEDDVSPWINLTRPSTPTSPNAVDNEPEPDNTPEPDTEPVFGPQPWPDNDPPPF